MGLCSGCVAAPAVLPGGPAAAQETPEAPAADGAEPGGAGDSDAPAPDPNAFRVRFGFEGKAHYRDSENLRFPSPFPFPPEFLPPGATQAFLETVNEGQHFELSVLTLFVDASWGPNIEAHAKVDFIDLYDRNPTSSDKEIDVDELWIRFGSDPAVLSERFGLYLKVGKFGHFERQNDRHTESYGLVSTAFNRFEDQGLEVGAELRPSLLPRRLADPGESRLLPRSERARRRQRHARDRSEPAHRTRCRSSRAAFRSSTTPRSRISTSTATSRSVTGSGCASASRAPAAR